MRSGITPVASFALGLAVAVALTGRAGSRLEVRADLYPRDTEPVYLPSSGFLRLVSLGYEHALADVLWFRTINYFGKQYRSDRTYPWLARMCEVVTDLNPRAAHVYKFAGLVLAWETGQTHEAIRLLEKGVHNIPDSWQLEFWLGFTQYFFKNDYESAIRHMRRAAAIPGAHPVVGRLLGLFMRHQYGPTATLQFLSEIEESAGDDATREIVRGQIKQARLASDLERLNALVGAYRERFGRLPASIEEMVTAGLIEGVPTDPFGGWYRVNPANGTVESSTGHKPPLVHQSRRRAEILERSMPRP